MVKPQPVPYALEVAARRALEDWGMMLVDDADQADIEEVAAAQSLVACLAFHGEDIINGRVFVACKSSFAEMLTESVLGTSLDDMNPVMLTDCLCELVNLLAGHFLTEAYGTDTVFALSPPIASNFEYETHLAGQTRFTVLRADDSPVVIGFHTDVGGVDVKN